MRLLVFCLLLVLVSCSNQHRADDEVVTYEVSDPIEVYFCPRDNCSSALAVYLDSATESIHCALFEVELPEVIKVLKSKSGSIDVRVVVDDSMGSKINGSAVREDDSSQLMHNKFCVVDGLSVSTGSFNPTERGAFSNNNNLVIVDSKILARNYEDEFLELWNGNFGEGEKVKVPFLNYNGALIENYFCPDDSCSYHVIDALSKSKESIDFMTFSFTDEDVADAILFTKNVSIRGVFDKSQAGSKYSQYDRLEGFGIDVVKDSNPAFMHHKVFIIDNSTVITGSYNPTASGDTKNDENILIIHDEEVAARFIEEFQYLYSRTKIFVQ